MKYSAMLYKSMLDLADEYADKNSGCMKVSVGSVIMFNITRDPLITGMFGANRTLPISCKENGCQRVQLYGENSKLHRNPEDCRAIHSEVDAICNAAREGYSTLGATIFVTRYPCEACARAIVSAGISKVVYGREQECSEQTKEIFKNAGVSLIHVEDWDAPDVTY